MIKGELKPITIKAFDLSQAFYRCCKSILVEGFDYKIDKGSSEGRFRKEFDFVTIQISRPDARPLYPDIPDGIPSPCNMSQIEDYMDYLITPTKQENEQYTYGEFIHHQIPTVIERYKRDGEGCNQLYMTIGDQYSMQMPDPPCLRGIDTRIRYGRLHFMVYFRSWDLWAGFPVNLGGIQLLKEYMANEIGIEDGELIACSKGLHLYDHCWELAEAL